MNFTTLILKNIQLFLIKISFKLLNSDYPLINIKHFDLIREKKGE